MLNVIKYTDDLFRAAGIASQPVREFIAHHAEKVKDGITAIIDDQSDFDYLGIILDYEHCNSADFIGDAFEHVIAEYSFQGKKLYLIMPFAIVPDTVFEVAIMHKS